MSARNLITKRLVALATLWLLAGYVLLVGVMAVLP
jgi:hypothetical protein